MMLVISTLLFPQKMDGRLTIDVDGNVENRIPGPDSSNYLRE